MKKGKSKMKIGVIVLVLISCISICRIYQKFRPSKKEMPLKEYFGKYTSIKEGSAILIFRDGIYKNSKILIDNNKKEEYYIGYNTLRERVTTKFFWDEAAKEMILTTPTEIIKIKPNSNEYMVGDTKKNFDSVILKEVDGKRYLALSFVDDYCHIEYKLHKNPDRLVMECAWDKELELTETKTNAEIRFKGADTSNILEKVSSGAKLKVIPEEDSAYRTMGFTKVISEDGVIGYIKDSKINKAKKQKLKGKVEYKGPKYTTLAKEGEKVSIGWINIENASANKNIDDWLKNIDNKKINVIAGTWLRIADKDGSIKSFASDDVIKKIHEKNMKAWFVINDFTDNGLGQTESFFESVSHTKTRMNLVNNIVNEVKKHGAEGINVDFEHIDEKSSSFYIQFLRELSVSCRKENIMLSVDSYVPQRYNKCYQVDEQGEFVDYVIIMAYDENAGKTDKVYSSSSISWVKTALTAPMDYGVPSSKIVIGLPFYWNDTTVDQNGKVIKMDKIPMTKTGDVLNGAQPVWDDKYKQNKVKYEKDGKIYEGWIEDAKSLKAKLDMLKKYKIAGVGFWRIGHETEDVWKIIVEYLSK